MIFGQDHRPLANLGDLLVLFGTIVLLEISQYLNGLRAGKSVSQKAGGAFVWVTMSVRDLPPRFRVGSHISTREHGVVTAHNVIRESDGTFPRGFTRDLADLESRSNVLNHRQGSEAILKANAPEQPR